MKAAVGGMTLIFKGWGPSLVDFLLEKWVNYWVLNDHCNLSEGGGGGGVMSWSPHCQ